MTSQVRVQLITMLLIYITNVEISNFIFQLFNVELADQLKVEIWNFHISDVYKQHVLTVLHQSPRSPSKDEKSRKVQMSSKVKKYSRSEHHALGAGLTSWRAWGSLKWDLCCCAGFSCPEHLGCYLSKCQTVNEK